MESKPIYKMYSFNSYNLDALFNSKIYLSNPKKYNDPHDSIIRISHKNETFLDFVSEYLLKFEADPSDERDEDRFSKSNLYYDWGYVDSFDDDGEPNFSCPLFSDIFQNTLRIVKSKTHFINEVKKIDWVQHSKMCSDYIEITDRIGIACFISSIHATQMWAYYANNHTGYCVEFELDKEKLKESNLLLEDVAYSQTKIAPIENDNYKDKSFIEQIKSKSNHWEHEKELRMILVNGSNKLISFPGKIKSINFGIEMPTHERKIIVDFMSKVDQTIEFYEMKMTYDSYFLNRNQFNTDLEWG